jgi:hypothetical protein
MQAAFHTQVIAIFLLSVALTRINELSERGKKSSFSRQKPQCARQLQINCTKAGVVCSPGKTGGISACRLIFDS